MFINNLLKSRILIFFDNYIITNYLKTILIEKIKKINIKKKLITIFKKKKKKNKNYFFCYFNKKIKFGYYLENEKMFFIPNNLIDIKKNIFPKKIFLFEILFKKLNIENKFLATRKLNFKKKKKINKILINKNYIGIIKNIINYGVFIDIGGYDGLLHISDIPVNKNIYKKFLIKNVILIKVIKFEKKLKKISLNLKKNYKKNIEKNQDNKNIICIVKKTFYNGIICYNNNSKKYILKNNFNFKKYDKIKSFFIIKKDNINYISLFYKIKKININFIKFNLLHKTINFFLMSCKKNKILYKKKIKYTITKNVFLYKIMLFMTINNKFNKFIFINKNYYITNNNFTIKIKKIIKKKINIKLLFLKKKKIYFFIRKY